jgi:ABC-type polysaccharide/polyol phosphate export permease
MAVKVGIKPRNFFWKMQTVFQRLNMVASGKMFVANSLPGSVLVMFTWNPLFHVIDQARGFAFINYQPRNSDLFYPLYFSLGLLMLGFIREYYTRQRRLRAG